MKKIAFIFLSILITFMIAGCAGYKPIFATGGLKFEIGDHKIEGNKKLGNQIYFKLKNLSKASINEKDKKNLNFLINVSQDKNATSKSNAGKILEYKITLRAVIVVTELMNNSKILDENLSTSVTYKVQDQYSETIKLENKSIEDLLNKIYEEFIIKLSEKLITQ